jgi:integrase
MIGSVGSTLFTKRSHYGAHKMENTKRANGEGGLRLRGQIWWILYRVDGKQFQKSSKGYFNGAWNDGRSEEVARQMLRAELTDTSRGAIPTALTDKLTYENLRDAYLEQNPEQRAYYGLQHLDKFFKGMAATSITTDVLRRFSKHRTEKDKVSGPTVRRNFVVLRAMFNQARKEGKLRLHDVPYFPMPEDSEPAGTRILPEEFARVHSHLPENLKPFFQTMYATGCRLGALQKITWEMVSKDCSTIEIPDSLVKSKKPLTLVLAGKQLEPIAAMLRKMFRDPSKPVFDSTNYRPEWAKACAKSGLGTWDAKTRTRTGVRIHDCRVSAAINLVESGVDTDTVMKIGGWKTMAMFSRYNVLDKSRIKAAMEKGGAYVAEAQANG